MDIEFLKKLKNSLTIKVFLIIFIALMVMSCTTYYFIMLSTPITFLAEQNDQIEQEIQKLIKNLEQVELEEGKNLIRSFISKYHVNILIQLSDQTRINPMTNDKQVNEKVEDEENTLYSMLTDDKQEVIVSQYAFYFKNASEQNTLIVYQNKTQNTYLLSTAFQKTLPWIFVITFLLSLLISYLFTYFITRPIVKMSAISKKMALLQLDVRCTEIKTDEIGVLGNSLNEMASKLATTLEELNQANNSLSKELRTEKEEAKRRWDFFSAISHELKTPLTVLKGQLDGMIQKVGAYQNRDLYLNKAMDTVNHMQEITGDILTILKAESSEVYVQKKETNFSEMIRNCLIGYLELIEHKQIQLEIHIIDNLIIEGNEQLLSKVISNLISNATEYTEKGKIVHINTKKEEQRVIFSVENEGAHIPKNKLNRLWEPFYRLETSRNRKNGGSGLGLYLVSQILEQHSFSYQMKNTEKGVIFIIEIPLQ